MRPIILIGGGGHALSVCEMAKQSSFLGYADLHPSSFLQIPYLGTDEEVMGKYSPSQVLVHHTFVYADKVDLNIRQRIIDRYCDYESATLIAQTALVTAHSQLEAGCAVMEKAVVNQSYVGANSIINTGAIVEHGCQLGCNVFVGPGAVLCGEANVGTRAFIGAGSIIRDKVTIGEGIVIGMGSRVTKDLLRPGLYFGNQFIRE
jgi:UDP-perosamine 4-acetyltransferase